MRTGNEALDILIQVAVIAIVAAILTWILGELDAPSIISTIVWILALLAIAYVVIQLLQGRGRGGTPGGPPGGGTPGGGVPPRRRAP